ncbi:hypothetical protein Tco_1275737 [Tanacetum coccineum]
MWNTEYSRWSIGTSWCKDALDYNFVIATLKDFMGIIFWEFFQAPEPYYAGSHFGGVYRSGIRAMVIENQDPPSPDYVPGPEEPEQAPPSPIYVPFVPKPVYPEFLPEFDPEEDPEEDDEEDPADYPVDRGADRDDEEPSDDDDDNDDDAEEEEHLAPADPAAVAYSADQDPPFTLLCDPELLGLDSEMQLPSTVMRLRCLEICFPLRNEAVSYYPGLGYEVGGDSAAGTSRQAIPLTQRPSDGGVGRPEFLVRLGTVAWILRSESLVEALKNSEGYSVEYQHIYLCFKKAQFKQNGSKWQKDACIAFNGGAVMDMSNITRKQLKNGHKNGHEERMSDQEG